MILTYEHPSELLPLYTEFVHTSGLTDFDFEFSKYIYVPQEISESRHVFHASASSAQDIFTCHAKNLLPKEEIAFHSRILVKGQLKFHIPFIDMGCDAIEPQLPQLEKAFADFDIEDISIFHTGRSFHIYGHSLLRSEVEMIRFMGRILLLNLPKKERVIDERWVGHRLMAGYLTLRWTNNNPHYISAPRGISV